MVDLSKFKQSSKVIVTTFLALGLVAGCASSQDSIKTENSKVACASVNEIMWKLKYNKVAFDAGNLDSKLYTNSLKETVKQLTSQRNETSGTVGNTIEKIASELNALPIDDDSKLESISYAKVNEAIEELNTVCEFSRSTTPTPTSIPSPEIQNQEDLKLGGFESGELERIKQVRESLYNFVFAWSGLVAGTSTYPEVSIYCSNLEDANNYIRGVDSDSPYFEDLLDRAKDYLYETRSECAYAFKKNRLEDLGQSAEYASAGIAFFDQIISKSEENK